mmetsp:Transcript_96848/g.273921  ORF Transcript_96848/g.273921 Transcript_96848/m.273921 type:complete len:115 (+) Transcript_96848:104-448(+)
MRCILLGAVPAVIVLFLQGCGNSSETATTTTTAKCVPMTSTDPCFEGCHSGIPHNCTVEICKSLGNISCSHEPCELMGKNNTNTSHCMSGGKTWEDSDLEEESAQELAKAAVVV